MRLLRKFVLWLLEFTLDLTETVMANKYDRNGGRAADIGLLVGIVSVCFAAVVAIAGLIGVILPLGNQAFPWDGVGLWAGIAVLAFVYATLKGQDILTRRE